MGIGHGKEAEGQGAGGRGENSPPFLPAPLLLPLTLPQWQQRHQRLETGIHQSG